MSARNLSEASRSPGFSPSPKVKQPDSSTERPQALVPPPGSLLPPTVWALFPVFCTLFTVVRSSVTLLGPQSHAHADLLRFYIS